MTTLLHRNSRFVTVHNKYSKIPTWTSVHFATCVWRRLVVWSDLHFSLGRQQRPKCDRALRLVRPPIFLKLRSSSNPTNKNVTSSGLEISTVLSRWPLRIKITFVWHFFSQWPIRSLTKLPNFFQNHYLCILFDQSTSDIF
jgi:hypothetical protein